MPQKSIVYAVTRTRIHESRLLTQDRLLRLLESADVHASLYALAEMGYGGQDTSDFEKMIQDELIKTGRYLDEITPNIEATDVLRLKYDCQNLKAAIKSRMLGQAIEGIVLLGTVGEETLLKAIENGEFLSLPRYMGEAVQSIFSEMDLGHVTPSEVDFQLDRACFMDMDKAAKKSKVPELVELVSIQADAANLLMTLRVRNSENAESLLHRALLPGGKLDKHLFIQSLSTPEDALHSFLGLGKYDPAAREGMVEYIVSGTLTRLERLLDDMILQLFQKKRADSFSVLPIIGYQLAKEREGQAVRLVMVAKTNNMPPDMLKERLRELYE